MPSQEFFLVTKNDCVIKNDVITDSSSSSVAVGDFNNDLILDNIVAFYDTNNIGVLLGYGNDLMRFISFQETGFVIWCVILISKKVNRFWISIQFPETAFGFPGGHNTHNRRIGIMGKRDMHVYVFPWHPHPHPQETTYGFGFSTLENLYSKFIDYRPCPQIGLLRWNSRNHKFHKITREFQFPTVENIRSNFIDYRPFPHKVSC